MLQLPELHSQELTQLVPFALSVWHVVPLQYAVPLHEVEQVPEQVAWQAPEPLHQVFPHSLCGSVPDA